jgi:TonB family protein
MHTTQRDRIEPLVLVILAGLLFLELSPALCGAEPRPVDSRTQRELSPQQQRAVDAQAIRAAEYTPKPEYPLKARGNHFTGSGIILARVHVRTGRVVEALVARSTGHAILDNAAVQAFSQWRFKPGALTPIGVIAPWRHDSFGKEDALIKIPVNFAM